MIVSLDEMLWDIGIIKANLIGARYGRCRRRKRYAGDTHNQMGLCRHSKWAGTLALMNY